MYGHLQDWALGDFDLLEFIGQDEATASALYYDADNPHRSGDDLSNRYDDVSGKDNSTALEKRDSVSFFVVCFVWSRCSQSRCLRSARLQMYTLLQYNELAAPNNMYAQRAANGSMSASDEMNASSFMSGEWRFRAFFPPVRLLARLLACLLARSPHRRSPSTLCYYNQGFRLASSSTLAAVAKCATCWISASARILRFCITIIAAKLRKMCARKITIFLAFLAIKLGAYRQNFVARRHAALLMPLFARRPQSRGVFWRRRARVQLFTCTYDVAHAPPHRNTIAMTHRPLALFVVATAARSPSPARRRPLAVARSPSPARRRPLARRRRKKNKKNNVRCGSCDALFAPVATHAPTRRRRCRLGCNASSVFRDKRRPQANERSRPFGVYISSPLFASKLKHFWRYFTSSIRVATRRSHPRQAKIDSLAVECACDKQSEHSEELRSRSLKSAHFLSSLFFFNDRTSAATTSLSLVYERRAADRRNRVA